MINHQSSEQTAAPSGAAASTEQDDMSKQAQPYGARHVMSGHAVASWRAEMGAKLGLETGLNERDAAKLLGLSRQGYRNIESTGAPLYIAYACAALLAGIDPYRSKSKVKG